METSGKDVDYCALDLSLSELQRTFSMLPKGSYQHVKCRGVLGTYDDGLMWLKQPENRLKPLCILTMGSSLGNFDRTEAARFLSGFAQIMQPADLLIVGLDACQDEDKVLRAYNDTKGITHEFYLNGMANINKLADRRMFDPGDWTVIGQYNKKKHCHQAFYQANSDVLVGETMLKAGDRIRVEESYKYSPSQRAELWNSGGLIPRASFGSCAGDYRKSQTFLPCH